MFMGSAFLGRDGTPPLDDFLALWDLIFGTQKLGEIEGFGCF